MQSCLLSCCGGTLLKSVTVPPPSVSGDNGLIWQHTWLAKCISTAGDKRVGWWRVLLLMSVRRLPSPWVCVFVSVSCSCRKSFNKFFGNALREAYRCFDSCFLANFLFTVDWTLLTWHQCTIQTLFKSVCGDESCAHCSI